MNRRERVLEAMRPVEQSLSFVPRLRPIEAIALSPRGERLIGLRDRSGLSEAVLTVSRGALEVLTLIDGRRSLGEIQRECRRTYGRAVGAADLNDLMGHLRTAHFLEGEEFEKFYEQMQDAYQSSGVRRARHVTLLGSAAQLRRRFDEILSGSSGEDLGGSVVGLIAPHLDYDRGLPCYLSAYGTLHSRPVPNRVVILGTNHFGRSRGVVATAGDFETQIGLTMTDVGFLEMLECDLGGLRRHELDHDREHSVELQVAWLQHLFGPAAFRVVAFLCPDPCGPREAEAGTGEGVAALREFALALGDHLRADGADTLVVAGADLSHVGAAFGDERELTESFLLDVRRRDEAALDHVSQNDAEGFRLAVAQDNNPTRVCSAGCMYALMTALADRRPQRLGYHQAVDRGAQTCVTCTAFAFT